MSELRFSGAEPHPSRVVVLPQYRGQALVAGDQLELAERRGDQFVDVIAIVFTTSLLISVVRCRPIWGTEAPFATRNLTSADRPVPITAWLSGRAIYSASTTAWFTSSSCAAYSNVTLPDFVSLRNSTSSGFPFSSSRYRLLNSSKRSSRWSNHFRSSGDGAMSFRTNGRERLRPCADPAATAGPPDMLHAIFRRGAFINAFDARSDDMKQSFQITSPGRVGPGLTSTVAVRPRPAACLLRQRTPARSAPEFVAPAAPRKMSGSHWRADCCRQLRSRSSMPPAMLSTCPVSSVSLADQMDGRGVADMDARQFGFLEIALDAKRVLVDQRGDAAADRNIGARLQVHVGDQAVDGSADFGAHPVEFCQIAIGNGLVVGGLGFLRGSLGQFAPLFATPRCRSACRSAGSRTVPAQAKPACRRRWLRPAAARGRTGQGRSGTTRRLCARAGYRAPGLR